MPVHTIFPLNDPRWPEFVGRHPKASIFHTSGWLRALQQAYGYTPIAYTTSAPGQDLASAIPFCRIKTWLTGHRLVSLPFSDHCAPLVDSPQDLEVLLAAAEKDLRSESLEYVELRPLDSHQPEPGRFGQADSFCFHSLDIRPGLDDLWRAFHKDCVQRKIRRAEREGLSYEHGNSESSLRAFYALLIQTRRRHGLPPQPLSWFRTLVACLREAVSIRIARKDGIPVAAILTLDHPRALVYKYGCSDPKLNPMGGTQMLFWKAIQEAKAKQIPSFDLGRSDLEDAGLITFKDRWGAARSDLIYLRCSLRSSQQRDHHWQLNLARRLFIHFPKSFLSAAGRLLYRHIG